MALNDSPGLVDLVRDKLSSNDADKHYRQKIETAIKMADQHSDIKPEEYKVPSRALIGASYSKPW